MCHAISSTKIGIKIYEWYKMIRQFSVPDAEILKAEIEQELIDFENEQDVLMYYQLMSFRHQLMLDYIEPSDKYGDRPTTAELLEKIESSQKKLSGILQYYSYFFQGMYEFDKKEYVEAIGYYLKAEAYHSFVSDEVEKAEFHFKVGESFYIMKQTHMSMHHILQALKILDEYDLYDHYKIRKIHSLFVMAGNYDDLKSYKKALPHLEKALSLAIETESDHLICAALYNLGNSYDKAENYGKAIEFFSKAANLSRKKKLEIRPTVLFGLSWTLLKIGDYEKAALTIEEGLDYLEHKPDKLYHKLYRFLNSLYFGSPGKDEIYEVLNYFNDKKLFSYVESCSYYAAIQFSKIGDTSSANEFFLKVLEAQKQIQRGECMYVY